MKKNWLLPSIFSLMPLCLHAQDDNQPIGIVLAASGSVIATELDGDKRFLQRSSALYEGDTITTGNQSRVQFRFSDNGRVAMQPESSFFVETHRFSGQEDGTEQASYELLRGGLQAITGLIGHTNKEQYNVNTPIANIGLRGTHWTAIYCDTGCDGNPPGLYGGVAEGGIDVCNAAGCTAIDADTYFYTPSINALTETLLAPPSVVFMDSAEPGSSPPVNPSDQDDLGVPDVAEQNESQQPAAPGAVNEIRRRLATPLPRRTTAGRARAAHVVCGWLSVQGLLAPQGEFTFGVPQFSLLFSPILVCLAAGLGLLLARDAGADRLIPKSCPAAVLVDALRERAAKMPGKVPAEGSSAPEPFAGVPVPLIFLFGIAFLVWLPFRRTLTGRTVYAIGSAEGGIENELYQPLHARLLSGGRIAIANQGTEELRIYGPDGEHVRTVGRKGGGPGEFEDMWGLVPMPGDSLGVFDWSAKRLTLFDDAGAFGRMVSPGRETGFVPMLVGALDDGSFLLRRGINPASLAATGGGVSEDSLWLLRFDSRSGALLDSLAPFPGQERYIWISEGFFGMRGIHYGRREHVNVSGDHVYIGDDRAGAIRVLGPEGALRRIIRLVHEPRPVSDEALANLKAQNLDGVDPEELPEERRRNDEIPVAGSMPAFNGLFVDRDGRIWLEEEDGRWDRPDTWTVLDPEGRPLARIELPTRLMPLDARGDRLLAYEQDELEIEYGRAPDSACAEAGVVPEGLTPATSLPVSGSVPRTLGSDSAAVSGSSSPLSDRARV